MGSGGCVPFIAIYLFQSFFILFCCSVWGPFSGLQSFMNISRVAALHGVQSFRNGLLQCELPHGPKVLPENLLHPAWDLHRLQLPSGRVHLLSCGVLCNPRAAGWHLWSSMWVTGDSLGHLLPLLLPWSCCLQSCFTLIFSLLILTAAVCHFLPFPKHPQRGAISISVWLSCVWVNPADGWDTGAAPLFFWHRDHPCTVPYYQRLVSKPNTSRSSENLLWSGY